MKTVDKQREALKGVYKNPTWVEKVKRMPDHQVTAVFLRLKSQNKI